MKNIVLFCAAGMSTSLLVTKMEQAAKEMNYECIISAHPISELRNYVDKADICLLGPQVAFEKDKVERAMPCPVMVVDMVAYGLMDGKKVMKQVIKALGE